MHERELMTNVKKEKTEWKKVLLVIGVIIILAIASYGLFIKKEKPFETIPEDKGSVITDTDEIRQFENKEAEIPVEKITGGEGYADSLKDIQYKGTETDGDTFWIVFTLSGWYKGKVFDKAYYEFTEKGNYEIFMKIGDEMDPYDGITEGYIVETFKNNTPIAYIYLDEDWKKSMGNKTNIIYGKNMDKIKPFVWKKVADGIYRDSIVDDIERFGSDYTRRTSGIFVGDITLEDVGKATGDWTLIKLS